MKDKVDAPRVKEAQRTAPAEPELSPSQRQTLWTCLLLAVATLLVFGRMTGFDFITSYDDPDFVTSNPHVQHGLTAASLRWAFTSLFNYWQPLVWISYMVDCKLYGLSSGGFHFTNLVLHTANTLLLFLALKRMTRAHWPSALVAALFAFHPLHVETAAWISERKGLLSTTFWMLTMLSYACYTERRTVGRYLLTLFAFALGLMSKSMLVTLPCVLLLLDMWPLGRLQLGQKSDASPGQARHSWLKVILEKVPFFALAAVSSLLTVEAQRQTGTVWNFQQLPLIQRVPHALVEYVVYLRKMVWPNDLSVFYPYPGMWPWWIVAGAVAILLLITALTIVLLRKQPCLAVGWFWFVGTLFPVIGLVQVGEQAMADRYTYVPLIGVFILLAWGGTSLLQRFKVPGTVTKAIGVGLVALCAVATTSQLGHWRNSRLLFEHAERVSGPNYLALAVLGNLAAQDGRFDEAKQYLQGSLDLQPRHPDTLFAFGNLAFQQKDFKQASSCFQKVVAARPDMMEAHFHLAMALQTQGQIEPAIAHYKSALQLQPSLFQGHMLLGSLLQNQRNMDEALQQFREAVRLQPESPDALSRLAWVLVIHPDPKLRDGKEALQLATRACELTGQQQVGPLNGLAAAYAELGRFSEALQITQQALELAKPLGQPSLVEYIQKLQRLYQENRPCRELKDSNT